MSTNEEAFLKELTELTHKYKIGIGGCGCCDSPFLYLCENSGFYHKRGNMIEYQESEKEQE